MVVATAYRSAQLTSNNQADGAVTYTVNATDNAANTSTNSNNGSVTFDTTGPTGSVATYTNGYVHDAVGVGDLRPLLTGRLGGQRPRRSAASGTTSPLGGTCTGFGDFPTSAPPAVTSPFVDNTVDVRKLLPVRVRRRRQRQQPKHDHVTSSTVKVDTSAPSVPTLSYSSLTNVFVSGANVYYKSNATSGSFTVTASSTDAESASRATPSRPSARAGRCPARARHARTAGVSANPTTNASPFTRHGHQRRRPHVQRLELDQPVLAGRRHHRTDGADADRDRGLLHRVVGAGDVRKRDRRRLGGQRADDHAAT